MKRTGKTLKGKRSKGYASNWEQFVKLTPGSGITSFPFLYFSKVEISPKIKANVLFKADILVGFYFRCQYSFSIFNMWGRENVEFCNWSSRKVTLNWRWLPSSSSQVPKGWELLGRNSRGPSCPAWCPTNKWGFGRSTPAVIAGEEERWGASPKWPGSAPSLGRKQGRLSAAFASSPPQPTYPKPSVMTFSCSHFWQLPDTVSQTSLAANYHTNCQRQKPLPDCCPTSTPAYKPSLNKTAQNKQKCNYSVYTAL